MMRIKHNPASVTTLRHLTDAQNALAQSLERLSSGQKINSAADNPAGLVISENLRAEISAVQQALENTEISVSVVQTAEGALAEVSNLLIGMRQLAVAAANTSVHDYNSLTTIQNQLESALDSLDMVTRHTRFGSIPLLDGSRGTSGVGSSKELVFIGATSKTHASPLEGFEVEITRLPERAVMTSEFNDKIAADLRISLEEEDGNLIEVQNPTGGSAKTFISRLRDSIEEGHLNLDLKFNTEDEELTIVHREFGLAKGFIITSFKNGSLGDEAGKPQLILGTDIEGKIGGENADGNGRTLKGSIDNFKTSDLSIAYSGSQLGTVGTMIVAQNAMKFQIGANEGDKIGIAIDSTHSTSLGRGVPNRSGFKNLADVNVHTPQGATDTIRLVDEASYKLLSLRGKLGAIQRYALESNMATLRITHENLIAAESAIRDSDLADEVAHFTKNMIMTEAAAAAAAQSNRMDPEVLRLLINHH